MQRSGLHFVVPSAASVLITFSWRQAIDPSDPSSDSSDPAQSCAASAVVTLRSWPRAAAGRSRGVERADVNGSVKLLARTQPSLEAARYGVTIEARPGGVDAGRPRPFGYDVQVRQSGRLLARVRVGGRCVERRESRGLVVRCRIARRSAELR